jgi:hypothetical protein
MLPRTEPPRSATRGYNLRSNRHGCHHRDASGRAFQQSQGHLKIVFLSAVEPSGNMPRLAAVVPETYAEYPLIILSQEAKEIARMTADENGNYRISLPPGAYVLDVKDRVAKRIRAKPQPFTVVSNQSVRVDMNIDTGLD